MGFIDELDDSGLLQIIKNVNSSEEDIEEAKEIIFNRYEYMTKYMLKKLRLKYSSSEEEDLIHHGYLLIVSAINSHDIEKGCPFKSFLYHVIRKGLLNQFFRKDKFRKNEISMTGFCNDNEYDYSAIDSISDKHEELHAYEELILEEQTENIRLHLTDSEYNCIMARYYGASYKETAKTFGYTVKQVDNKIQSVRKDKIRFIKMSS